MASDELKPCPFCGGPVKPPVSRPSSTDHSEGYVAFLACYCGGYSATAHRMGRGETEQEAIQDVIAKWNRRAQDFDAMRQRAEKAERDAARYRWITENADVDCRGHAPDGDFNSLDERIDAALAKQAAT